MTHNSSKDDEKNEIDEIIKFEDDEKKKEIEEIIKFEILQLDDIAESEIQVVNDDDGPAAKKSKLGKFLGKKYGIGVMQSYGSTSSNSVSKLTRLGKPIMS